jgi:alpha-glucosidase (family GH31 glycosyl hydrolase)
MYPEITPLIRDTIKRRYELIPYLYSLMLESHISAIPPQRWTGWGYQSDPEVWTSQVMAGEEQYWLGDTLLVGGVYEEGKSVARMYLPTKGADDDGYLNLNAPHQHLKSGQWVDIQSEWKAGIPILARIGGGVVVGKDIQTRSPGDQRFPSPNAVEDDYRAVEIFPPKRTSAKTYSYTWYEDDGISAKPQISHFTLRYSSTAEQILVDLSKDTENKFIPIWKDLSIILPVGDSRSVVMANSNIACSKSEPIRGRAVFKMVA